MFREGGVCLVYGVKGSDVFVLFHIVCSICEFLLWGTFMWCLLSYKVSLYEPYINWSVTITCCMHCMQSLFYMSNFCISLLLRPSFILLTFHSLPSNYCWNARHMLSWVDWDFFYLHLSLVAHAFSLLQTACSYPTSILGYFCAFLLNLVVILIVFALILPIELH